MPLRPLRPLRPLCSQASAVAAAFSKAYFSRVLAVSEKVVVQVGLASMIMHCLYATILCH